MSTGRVILFTWTSVSQHRCTGLGKMLCNGSCSFVFGSYLSFLSETNIQSICYLSELKEIEIAEFILWKPRQIVRQGLDLFYLN